MKESLEALEAKKTVYSLLSCAYHTPDTDFIKKDFSVVAGEALRTVNPELCGEHWEKMVSYLTDRCEPLELALDYTRLFRGPVKAEVYPYESMYIDGEAMGSSALDVVARYKAAGVSMANDFKDLPDHISAELEFMHYLCGKELEARREGNGEAECFYDWRQGFLKNHLSRWIPRFAELVRQHAATPYYAAIAQVTNDFISQETSWLSAG